MGDSAGSLPVLAGEGAHQGGAPVLLEAEQALLGALLYNNQAWEKVSDFLQPAHFAHPVHGKIYATLRTFIERNQVADPLTLGRFFEHDPDLAPVGGARYLDDLAAGVVSVVNVQDYGRTLYDLYLRRQLVDIGETMVLEARQHHVDQPAPRQIEKAEQKLFDLATTGVGEGRLKSFRDALTESIVMAEQAFRTDHHVVGLSTGLSDLDAALGGLHPSDLLILAGRPSMGKSALATNIAFSVAQAGLRKQHGGGTVAFFSLEMSSEQLATRLLAQESRVPSDKIRRGKIREEDFHRFAEVGHELNRLPLWIDDTPALNVAALRTRARRIRRQHGLDLIVIDYLQLMQPVDSSRKDNRVQEVSDITRALKGLAKDLNVPVLALSQLSRAVEQRDDKRPQLADLRESGSIEQDADVVMFVYREEYYVARKQPLEGSEKFAAWQSAMNQVRNKAEVLVAKQRHGPIGNVQLFYDGPLTRFGNLDHHDRV